MTPPYERCDKLQFLDVTPYYSGWAIVLHDTISTNPPVYRTESAYCLGATPYSPTKAR